MAAYNHSNLGVPPEPGDPVNEFRLRSQDAVLRRMDWPSRDSTVHLQPIFLRLGNPSLNWDGLPIRGMRMGQSILHFPVDESFTALPSGACHPIANFNGCGCVRSRNRIRLRDAAFQPFAFRRIANGRPNIATRGFSFALSSQKTRFTPGLR